MRFVRRGPTLPADVASALGERARDVLSFTRDARSSALLVATKTHVYAVRSSAGEGDGAGAGSGSGAERGTVDLLRPWHLVDTGTWDDETRTLTVTWVDRTPSAVWVLEEESTFPQVLRERVQASVVLADEVDLGAKRRARVVVRKDLETQALLGQTILGRGVRSSDPGVREETRAALDRLREQVGLI